VLRSSRPLRPATPRYATRPCRAGTCRGSLVHRLRAPRSCDRRGRRSHRARRGAQPSGIAAIRSARRASTWRGLAYDGLRASSPPEVPSQLPRRRPSGPPEFSNVDPGAPRASELVRRSVRDVDVGGRLLWIGATKTAAGRRRLLVPDEFAVCLVAIAAGRAGQAAVRVRGVARQCSPSAASAGKRQQTGRRALLGTTNVRVIPMM